MAGRSPPTTAGASAMAFICAISPAKYVSNTVAASTVRARTVLSAELRASWYCCQASSAATAASTSTPASATGTTRPREACPAVVPSDDVLDRRQAVTRRTKSRPPPFPPGDDRGRRPVPRSLARPPAHRNPPRAPAGGGPRRVRARRRDGRRPVRPRPAAFRRRAEREPPGAPHRPATPTRGREPDADRTPAQHPAPVHRAPAGERRGDAGRAAEPQPRPAAAGAPRGAARRPGAVRVPARGAVQRALRRGHLARAPPLRRRAARGRGRLGVPD